jgi:hypothetical protein
MAIAIATTISAILQALSFARTPLIIGAPKASFGDAASLGIIQQFLMQTVGLLATLSPAVQESQLGLSFSMTWMWICSAVSFLAGLLSVVFYPCLPPGWPPMLQFISAAMQGFVVMQLVLAVNRAELKSLKDRAFRI